MQRDSPVATRKFYFLFSTYAQTVVFAKQQQFGGIQEAVNPRRHNTRIKVSGILNVQSM